MKRFLITTADERTWRRDCQVLFLGEWCRRYNRRPQWEHLDAVVVPYHWDNREQYYRDYLYLCSVYEDVLCRARDVLNDLHGTSYSVRYWRILIGPWLYLFTQTLFDRWTMIRRASEFCDISGTLIVRDDPAARIPRDLRGMSPDSLAWNHLLFGRAIQHQGAIPWTELSPTDQARPSPSGAERPGVRRAIRRLASSVQALLTRDDEALIVDSYLPAFQQAKLELMLGQVPKRWPVPQCVSVPPNMAWRSALRVHSDRSDPFHQFLCEMVPEQIPTVYVEGYADLQRLIGGLPWPRRPLVIFTSNQFQFAEPFKAWAAQKVDGGVPLVVGQHGGFAGTSKWNSGEDHQVAIADRFITWGWADDREGVYPGLALTNIGKPRGTWDRQGTLLLVPTVIRPMGFKSSSWPMGPNQTESYFHEQLRFVEALDPQVRRSVILRIRKSYDDTIQSGFFDRFRLALPDVRLDDSSGPIERQIRNCRLFVYPCNSTGFLETLARDIPTMIFWNPRYFELRPSAQPYFELLRDARIYHETPDAAAAHVQDIWHDVAAWWYEASVVQARREFCAQYARMPDRPIGFLATALRSVSTRVRLDPADTGLTAAGQVLAHREESLRS